MITILYATNKSITLKERDDTLITEYTEAGFLDTGSFGYEETGFYLALSLKVPEGRKSNQRLTNITEYFTIYGVNYAQGAEEEPVFIKFRTCIEDDLVHFKYDEENEVLDNFRAQINSYLCMEDPN